MAENGDVNLIILKVGSSHLVKQNKTDTFLINERARIDVKGFCCRRTIRIQKS